MNSLSNVDPKLEGLRGQLARYIKRTFFDDPTVEKLYHPKFKNFSFFYKIRNNRIAREQAMDIRRKYRGEFHLLDILNENKLRLLFFNMGEMLLIANNNVFNQLSVFSNNFFRGYIPTYLLNLGAYLGVHGVSANMSQNSSFPMTTYLASFTLLSTLTYPLQYITLRNVYHFDRPRSIISNYKETLDLNQKGKLLFTSTPAAITYLRMRHYFPHFLIFNFFYGSSITLYNTPNEYIKMLYYPAIVISGIFLASSSVFFKALHRTKNLPQTRILPNLDINCKTGVNFGTLAVFSLINFCLPLTIPQLKSKEEYKHEYFEHLKENSVFFNTESMFE